mmetsp:Transcript_91003/g.161988  ORF Transcript_91003/g.161988 Transcript_91003/m.161988 type:complete len:104 (+) Transcript_91003:680-991(+)
MMDLLPKLPLEAGGAGSASAALELEAFLADAFAAGDLDLDLVALFDGVREATAGDEDRPRLDFLGVTSSASLSPPPSSRLMLSFVKQTGQPTPPDFNAGASAM